MASLPVRTSKSPASPDELRCDCGRLIARRVPGGIELRCGRCKAHLYIALGQEDAAGRLRVVRYP